MSTKRKMMLVGLLVVVGLLICFLALPMARFSAARRKYPVGMSLEQAWKIAKAPFEIRHAAYPVSPGWTGGEMPEHAKQTIVVVGMYCPKECVLLGFNSYSNLVEVQPVNDPIDLALWLRSRK